MGYSLLVRDKMYFLKNIIHVYDRNSLFYLIVKALSGHMKYFANYACILWKPKGPMQIKHS